MKKRQNPVLKTVSCLVMTCAMLFFGNLRECVAPSVMDVPEVVRNVIGTPQTESSELLTLAKESNEVFNSYVGEEDEKKPEPTPPSAIKETQLV